MKSWALCHISISCPYLREVSHIQHTPRRLSFSENRLEAVADHPPLQVHATLNPTSSSRTWQPSFRGDLSPSLTAGTPWHFHLSPNRANHRGQCIPPAISPFSRAGADARRLTLAQTTCYPIPPVHQWRRRERNTSWLMESEHQGRGAGIQRGCLYNTDWLEKEKLSALWFRGSRGVDIIGCELYICIEQVCIMNTFLSKWETMEKVTKDK